MQFVFDIDGTLCFDGKTIEPAIINALQTLIQQGHEVIFASARPIRDLLPVLPDAFHGFKLVGGNGTFTAENKQIKTSHLPADTIAELLAIIEAHELNYLADSEWDYSFKGDMNHPIYRNISQLTAKNMELSEISNMCKLVLFEPNEQVIEAVAKLDVAITHYKSENAIDIAPKNVNKVHGLKELGITEFIAFGNDANDECLFREARFSYCVGDHEVKQWASRGISKDEVAQTILTVCEMSR